MKVIKVKGGIPLFGEVDVSGSKNAALPIIFASLVTRGVSKIEGIPKIGDTAVALSLIRSYGAEVSERDGATYINTENLKYCETDPRLTGAIRASTYLLGATLSRFGECRISDSGGCRFSDRPIDMHIQACKAFGGAERDGVIKTEKLSPTKIKFSKISVGATINALILAASTEGESVIECFAREPHVLALCDYLRSAGAKIKFSEQEIRIRGGRLGGGSVRIIGDMIEAGTYLAAGIVTGGEVTVKGVSSNQLEAFLKALELQGASLSVNKDSITAKRGKTSSFVKLIAEAYPGFPTDLQPIIAPILAQGAGGIIEDRVWTSRYGYLKSLTPFGIKYSLDARCAEIYPSSLRSGSTSSTDLRGGMAALLCALAAEGESRVDTAEYILRGYEAPAEKLRSLGATVSIYEDL